MFLLCMDGYAVDGWFMPFTSAQIVLPSDLPSLDTSALTPTPTPHTAFASGFVPYEYCAHTTSQRVITAVALAFDAVLLIAVLLRHTFRRQKRDVRTAETLAVRAFVVVSCAAISLGAATLIGQNVNANRFSLAGIYVAYIAASTFFASLAVRVLTAKCLTSVPPTVTASPAPAPMKRLTSIAHAVVNVVPIIAGIIIVARAPTTAMQTVAAALMSLTVIAHTLLSLFHIGAVYNAIHRAIPLHAEREKALHGGYRAVLRYSRNTSYALTAVLAVLLGVTVLIFLRSPRWYLIDGQLILTRMINVVWISRMWSARIRIPHAPALTAPLQAETSRIEQIGTLNAFPPVGKRIVTVL